MAIQIEHYITICGSSYSHIMGDTNTTRSRYILSSNLSLICISLSPSFFLLLQDCEISLFPKFWCPAFLPAYLFFLFPDSLWMPAIKYYANVLRFACLIRFTLLSLLISLPCRYHNFPRPSHSQLSYELQYGGSDYGHLVSQYSFHKLHLIMVFQSHRSVMWNAFPDPTLIRTMLKPSFLYSVLLQPFSSSFPLHGMLWKNPGVVIRSPGY